mgnify:CR=1 FL=1
MAQMSDQFSAPFASFFQAGFECSSHRRRDGVRLDLIRATSHDRHVASDYRQCAELGLRTLRDGLRWHLIEKSPGTYDWSSWTPSLEAAEDLGLQIIWDLFHYGSPDCVDQAAPDFAERFTEGRTPTEWIEHLWKLTVQRAAEAEKDQRRRHVADQHVLEHVRREEELLADMVERGDERERPHGHPGGEERRRETNGRHPASAQRGAISHM